MPRNLVNLRKNLEEEQIKAETRVSILKRFHCFFFLNTKSYATIQRRAEEGAGSIIILLVFFARATEMTAVLIPMDGGGSARGGSPLLPIDVTQ